MRRDLVHGLWFLGALLSALLASERASRPERPPPALRASGHRTAELAPEIVQLASGTRALRDAGGFLIPLRDYTRIASGTLQADRVLADLLEPTRVVAYSDASTRTPSRHRYAGKAAIRVRDQLEQLLTLAPDLLFVSELASASDVARLREHGVQVFDLGPMRGLSTLIPTIHAIGLLIGAEERALAYADALQRRMRAVSPPRPGMARPRALYLSAYGDLLYGAGAATSYHDVMEHAGLVDAASQHGLSGWPQLTSEQVLAIEPELLVTRTGMGALLCRRPGLSKLAPCLGRGRIVELEGSLLDDPGPGMLDATEALASALLGR